MEVMQQKGRGEQPIKYKSEVLKIYPKAIWVYKNSVGVGAIMIDGNRISHTYKVAWKAWEDAYYTHSKLI